MASYPPDFYGEYPGESYQIPYSSSSYDIVPFQNSISLSPHDYGDPEFIGFDSSPYGGDYVPFPTRFETNYSAYVATEPTEFIHYDPFRVAHSAVSELDDAEFAEYDPTPYGGGYALSPTRSEINYSAYVVTEPTKLIQYDPIPVSHSTVSKLDDSEFVEYDPTPYGSDYDPFPTRSEMNYSAYALTEPTKLFSYDPILVSHSAVSEIDDAEFAEYDPTPCGGVYDPFPTRSEMNYSANALTEPTKLFYYDPILVSHSAVSELDDAEFAEYDPTPYGGAYDPFSTRSEINYSAYALTEPTKVIQYDRILVSHSAVSELDDTEFAEYDTTPYGGGYDPSLTYGKPLPPSDQICYPRSSPESNALSLDNNFSYGSIPSPYGGKDDGKSSTKPAEPVEEKQVGYGDGDSSTKPAESVEEEHVGYGDGDSSTKPTKPAESVEEKHVGYGDGDSSTKPAESVEEEHVGYGDGDSSTKPTKPTKPAESVEEEQVGYGGHGRHPPGKPFGPESNSCDEYYLNPWSGYDYGVGNERNGHCGCGYGDYKQEPQFPCGYGLDAVDLCEWLFGYWPCLYRNRRENWGPQNRH